MIESMVEQINHELNMVLEHHGKDNEVAMSHVERIEKQLDSLRYHLFQSLHVSGTVK